MGVTHEIWQGEGGEQGDPLMPALYACGQHRALVHVSEVLQDSERLFAFMDDIYVCSKPDRTEALHQSLDRQMRDHARIRLHQGKTRQIPLLAQTTFGPLFLLLLAQRFLAQTTFWPTPLLAHRIFASSRRHGKTTIMKTENFGLFWAALLKMSGFTHIEFWPLGD